MPRQTDRATLKARIRDRMLSLEAAELAAAKAHYETFLQEAKLDENESHDTDDVADARGNADLAAAFEHPMQTHHAKIDVLENLDFAVTDTVAPGAVVGFGGRRFVVSVATSQFDLDGVSYMGISPQSPIYAVIDGLQEGDSFRHNGRDMVLDTVF